MPNSIFIIYNHISLNQKKKRILSACNVTLVLIKQKKKANLRLYLDMLETKCGDSMLENLKVF